MKKYLVGADEVGRGCLFGPVVAAAVILGNKNNFDLKDSKKLYLLSMKEIHGIIFYY